VADTVGALMLGRYESSTSGLAQASAAAPCRTVRSPAFGFDHLIADPHLHAAIRDPLAGAADGVHCGNVRR
jgi:hypothetical protein